MQLDLMEESDRIDNADEAPFGILSTVTVLDARVVDHGDYFRDADWGHLDQIRALFRLTGARTRT
jgi:hypothetical protein